MPWGPGGFESLNSFYDVYPLAPGDRRVFEDTYDWFKLQQPGQKDKTVGMHEAVAPPALLQVMADLNRLAEQLPVGPVQGYYLIGGEAEILNYKRAPKSGIVVIEAAKNPNAACTGCGLG